MMHRYVDRCSSKSSTAFCWGCAHKCTKARGQGRHFASAGVRAASTPREGAAGARTGSDDCLAWWCCGCADDPEAKEGDPLQGGGVLLPAGVCER